MNGTVHQGLGVDFRVRRPIAQTGLVRSLIRFGRKPYQSHEKLINHWRGSHVRATLRSAYYCEADEGRGNADGPLLTPSGHRCIARTALRGDSRATNGAAVKAIQAVPRVAAACRAALSCARVDSSREMFSWRRWLFSRRRWLIRTRI